MKQGIQYKLVLIVLAGIMISSCVKKPTYTSTPLISYNNFFRYGKNAADPDSVVLAINFQDEEGDIGLAESDRQGFFKMGNLWMIYFYDSTGNNNWAAWDGTNPPLPPFDTLKIPFSVPVVLPQNDNSEPMKGIIYVKMNRGIFRWPSHTKIMYKIYLYDKAMHKSNVIDTPAFIF